MELNNEQRVGIQLTRKAPGGILTITGVPGAGKTRMIRNVIKHFSIMNKAHALGARARAT